MVVRIRDVAAHVGVSPGTVSNVLNRPQQVNGDLVERVLAGIRELGYVRNDAARQLRAGMSRTLGMVVQDSSNPFFADMALAAEDRAADSDRMLIVGNSHHDPARESRYIDLFQQQRVQGVLIAPLGDLTGPLQRLQDSGIAAVLVQRGVDSRDFCSVSGDDELGGFLAVRHLLDIGRRRVAFVGGPLGIRGIRDRLDGARRAISERRDATLEVIDTSSLTVATGREVARLLLERTVRDRPDGVFTANDLLALGVIQGISMTSPVSIPDDIAVIGYDDISFASASVVPLSTIRQPGTSLGETGIELIQEECDSPRSHTHRHVMFRPELIVRQSTVGFDAADRLSETPIS